MGDVIQLPARKTQIGINAGNDLSGRAQILFFTGVRYQRMTEYTPNETSGKGAPPEGRVGGRRRRKRG